MGLKVCQLCAVDFTLKHFLLPLIDGMRDAGWEVTGVCSDGPAIRELRARGYDVETINIARSFNLFRHIGSMIKLVRLFKARRFDVVHVHTPVAALIGRIAARLAGVPLVVYTAHGFYFHDEMPAWKRRIFVSLEKLGSICTDLLFTQSAEDAQTAEAERLAPRGKILAIGNGVDPARFDPARTPDGRDLRRQLGIPEGAFVVGIIARMVEEKGVCDFLQAAVDSATQNPDIHFLMIGERLDSDHAGHVAEDIGRASAALGSRLVMTGARSDIPELLAAMDVFCLPSWREGMPRTIIEAMMMGKAVVATDIRGSREEVIHNGTGVLVPTHAPAALAAAFLSCADDRAWTSAMGAAGRIRALELYDEHRIVSTQIDRIAEQAENLRAPRRRVCIILTSPFAYEAFLKPHVAALLRECSVTVCLNTAESAIPVSIPEGAQLVSMPIVRDISPARDFLALVKVWRFLRRERFDLVFSITPKGGMVAMLAAAMARVPCRVHCFTGQVWATRRGVGRLALQAIDRTLSLCATHLLADSPSQRQFLVGHGVVPVDKIRVLGRGSISGVDLTRFHPDERARAEVRQQFGLAGDDLCLLFVGRLTQEKGVADLVAAFRGLAPHHPQLHLVLVGPDEASISAEWSGIPRLHLVRYTATPQHFMAAGDILCLPSHREGFGSVLIEAGASGLPVVASRIYGVTDAVVEGETGLLHRPGEVEELAQKIEELISSSALRDRLANCGRRRAVDEFDQNRVVATYAAFFTELMETRCSHRRTQR